MPAARTAIIVATIGAAGAIVAAIIQQPRGDQQKPPPPAPAAVVSPHIEVNPQIIVTPQIQGAPQPSPVQVLTSKGSATRNSITPGSNDGKDQVRSNVLNHSEVPAKTGWPDYAPVKPIEKVE